MFIFHGSPRARAHFWVQFPPAALVAYISRFIQLNPGDVIATGTPAGVGHGMDPKTYLRDGQEIRVAIDGLGEQRNIVRIR